MKNKILCVLPFIILNLDLNENNTPESWSVEQVTQWLSSIGFNEFTETFRGKFNLILFYKSSDLFKYFIYNFVFCKLSKL